jgi:hypothetical protein
MMLVIACHEERGLHELLDEAYDLVEVSIEGRQVRPCRLRGLLGLASLGLCLCGCHGDRPASE